ncbi:Protein arginine N-methyltransferase 3 [Polyrhizophydium stewartii]|uniref:type I protein arginine methyltransferase n=1 Tax=Polyrhizophydium stewartii TaxID=2732419 RepID=A0ABR4N4B0_9FUNG
MDPRDEQPADSDGSNQDNFSDWEDDEDDDAGIAALCPLCAFSAAPRAVFSHMASVHAFDLHAVRKQLGLDFYGSMRLINYVRKTKVQAQDLLSGPKDWVMDDQLLAPVVENDPLLYAFEDADDSDWDDTPAVPERAGLPHAASARDAGSADLVQQLLAELQIANSKLEQVTTSIRDYKDEVRKTFLDSGRDAENPSGEEEKIEGDWEMDYYFGSYAATEIHEIMLKDSVRTEAYRNFIYNNKDFFKGKTVLDVGCGTGILSMFAAKAGAKQVIAVDNSTIIKKARAIAAANGLDGIITFVAGKIEEVKMPVEKVDVIISEWMGYFLLFEGMLDSVLRARDMYLSPDGLMVPSHAIIKIAGIDDEEWINDRLHFWTDVYGFNMDIMKKAFLLDGQVDFADAATLITDDAVVSTIDTSTVTVPELDFESDYTLTVARSGTLHALCSWFDIEFRGHERTGPVEVETFSTGPRTKNTHWKQTMFVLDRPVAVVAGDVITGRFSGVKSPENHRDMVVTFDLAITARGITVPAKSFNVR